MTKGLYLGFWAKQSGNALTIKSGLSKDNIEALRNLKEGDRLILFNNKVDDPESKQPNYTLKVYTPRNDDGGL